MPDPEADAIDDEAPTCPNCGGPLLWERCFQLECDGGAIYDEEGYESCSTCRGYGGWHYCPTCHICFDANTV